MAHRIHAGRQRRLCTAACLLLLVVAGTLAGCASEPRSSGQVALSTPLRPPDDAVLPDFGEVRKGQLYRGGQPGTAREGHSADGYELLDREYKVRTIVDLTNQSIDRWIMGRKSDCAQMAPTQRQLLKYVAIPAVEWHPSRENLLKFLRVFEDPANRPVFLHCSAGENRTGAMIAGFRIVEDSWQPADAKQEMRRFNVAPFWTLVNDRFIDRLAEERDAILAQVAAVGVPDAVIVSCDGQSVGMPSSH